jgi:tol-pal system protein YbgF
MRYIRTLAVLTATTVLAVGCATGSSSDLSGTVISTHRKVTKLEQDLSGTVAKLNETAADLAAQQDTTSQSTLNMLTMLEENQVRLQTMQARLDDLTRVVYEKYNLTPPPPANFRSGPPRSVIVDPVEIKIEEPVISEPQVRTPVPGTPPARPEEEMLEPTTPAPRAQGGESAVSDFKRAMNAFNAKQFDQALGLFSSYLDTYPNSDLNDRAQLWKGECHFQLSNFNQAVIEFEKLQSRYRTSQYVPHSIYREALSLESLGRTAQAKTKLEQLVLEYPMEPAAESARKRLENM